MAKSGKMGEKREQKSGKGGKEKGMGIHPKRATLATAMVFPTGNSIEQKGIRFIY